MRSLIGRVIRVLCILLALMAAVTVRLAQAQTQYYVGYGEHGITPCNTRLAPTCPAPTRYIWLDKTDIEIWNAPPNTIAEVIDEELTVRVLAISDAPGSAVRPGHLVVLVALDSVVMDDLFAAEVKRRLAISRGVAPEEIFINVAHAHNTPALAHIGVTPDYFADVVPTYVNSVLKRVVQAAEDAIDNRQPAQLYFGHGESIAEIGQNRRLTDPEAVYDMRLDVLEVRDLAGKTIAVGAFHGCHPLTMFFTREVSPDYPGAFRRRLETWLASPTPPPGFSTISRTPSPGAKALFFQGFGGNCEVPPGGTIAKETAGAGLARDTAIVLESCSWGCTGMTQLSGPLLVEGTMRFFRTKHDRGSGEDVAPPKRLPVPAHTVGIGTTWRLIAVGHEVVGEWGDEVRDSWAGVDTGKAIDRDYVTVMGYTGAVESYLPTARMWRLDQSYVGDCGFPEQYEGCKSFEGYPMRYAHWSAGEMRQPITDLQQNTYAYPFGWNLAAAGDRTPAAGSRVSVATAPIFEQHRFDVFARFADGSLRWRRWERGKWRRWKRGIWTTATWRTLVLSVGSNPVAVAPERDVMYVFYRRASDRALAWVRTTNGGRSWSRSAVPGTVLTAAPAATSWAKNRVDVVFVTPVGALAHLHFDVTTGSYTWGTPPGVPGGLNPTIPPAIVATRAGRLDIFARSNAHTTFWTYFGQPSASWGRWRALTGVLASRTGPVAISLAPGRADVFVRSLDRGFWYWSVQSRVAGTSEVNTVLGWTHVDTDCGRPLVGQLSVASRAPSHAIVAARDAGTNLCVWEATNRLPQSALRFSPLDYAPGMDADPLVASTPRGHEVFILGHGPSGVRKLWNLHWNQQAIVGRPWEVPPPRQLFHGPEIDDY